MSDRYAPGSAPRNSRKKARYESSSDDGHSPVGSDKDGDSDSGGSYITASTASPRRRSSTRSEQQHHHNRHHSHQSHHRDPAHRSYSQRNHERSHRHSHHRRQKLLGPDDDEEKPRDGMALAVREEYAVQTVPRAHHDDADSSDEEEVYDHRPRPVSRRGHSHVGVSGGSRRRPASDADKGFFVAAAAMAVSLIICCGDGDND